MNRVAVKIRRKPRYAPHFQALIACVRADIAQRVKEALAFNGVHVKYLWLAEEHAQWARRDIPTDVDCVCVVRDGRVSIDRQRIMNSARAMSWSFEASPSIGDTVKIGDILKSFEQASFTGAHPLVLEDLEPKAPEPEPELDEATLDALTRPDARPSDAVAMAMESSDNEAAARPHAPTTNRPSSREWVGAPLNDPELFTRKPDEKADPMHPKVSKTRLKEIGTQVRVKREALTMTKAQVARALDITPSMIDTIEKGDAPSSDTVYEFLELLLGIAEGKLGRGHGRVKTNTKVAAAMAKWKADRLEANTSAPHEHKPKALPEERKPAPPITTPTVPDAPPAKPDTLVMEWAPTLSPFESFMVRVARMQTELGGLGLASVTITARGVSIERIP